MDYTEDTGSKRRKVHWIISGVLVSKYENLVLFPFPKSDLMNEPLYGTRAKQPHENK